MNHSFHREEIPFFLPEAPSPLRFGITGFAELPQSHLFGWVTSEHNTSGQQLPFQLWAIALICSYFRGESTIFQTPKLTTDEIPVPPTVAKTRKIRWLVQLLWGCGWGQFWEINSHTTEHCKLLELFWNSQEHCHLPCHSLTACISATRKWIMTRTVKISRNYLRKMQSLFF